MQDNYIMLVSDYNLVRSLYSEIKYGMEVNMGAKLTGGELPG